MRILPTEKYNQPFGILVKPPVKKFYAKNCWNELSLGKYKDCDFMVYNNYIDGDKNSTLIVFKKAGTWIKSKLKYTLNGERKTIWSYAK